MGTPIRHVNEGHLEPSPDTVRHKQDNRGINMTIAKEKAIQGFRSEVSGNLTFIGNFGNLGNLGKSAQMKLGKASVLQCVPQSNDTIFCQVKCFEHFNSLRVQGNGFHQDFEFKNTDVSSCPTQQVNEREAKKGLPVLGACEPSSVKTHVNLTNGSTRDCCTSPGSSCVCLLANEDSQPLVVLSIIQPEIVASVRATVPGTSCTDIKLIRPEVNSTAGKDDFLITTFSTYSNNTNRNDRTVTMERTKQETDFSHPSSTPPTGLTSPPPNVFGENTLKILLMLIVLGVILSMVYLVYRKCCKPPHDKSKISSVQSLLERMKLLSPV